MSSARTGELSRLTEASPLALPETDTFFFGGVLNDKSTAHLCSVIGNQGSGQVAVLREIPPINRN